MDFLIVLAIAAVATCASKFINKTINRGNEEDIERRKERIREISELSKDALDFGDKQMHLYSGNGGNDIHHKLLVAIFLSSVYEPPIFLALSLPTICP